MKTKVEEPSDLATAVKRRQEDIKRKKVEEREERLVYFFVELFIFSLELYLTLSV